jgi:hypothetical protein
VSSVIESACGCTACPVDIREYGFRAEWEDPFFKGKQCKWHLQIRGKYGCISPDENLGVPSVFVQFSKKPPRMSKVKWHEIAERGEQFTVPVSELKLWARAIGATR